MPTTTTKTIKSAGGDYSSIAGFEAGEQADLVSGDAIKQAECYAFEEQTVSGLNTFDGWTTDATRYIRVYAATGQRHTCAPNTGFRIYIQGSGRGFNIVEENMRVEGIACRSDEGALPGDRFFHVQTSGAAGDIRISKCWINTNTQDNCFIRIPAGDGVKVFNCMAGPGGGTFQGMDWSTTGHIWFYNNTVVGKNTPNSFFGLFTAFGGGPATIVFKNNIADRGPNPGASFQAYFLGATNVSGNNNLSDDTSAPGTSPVTNAAPTYVNESAGDLHLDPADSSGARNGGANLSGDSDLAFSDDIDDDLRPQGAGWDIGADEVFVPSGVRSTAWQGVLRRV